MLLSFVATALVAAAPSSTPSPALQALRQGPVEFRCDRGQAFSMPSRFVCNDNVLVRRGDLLLCCDQLEGYRSEAGAWQRFVCSKHVRAQRGDELMWADRATFVAQTNDLILTGHPRVQRAGNIIEGERVVVDVKYNEAHIEEPHGHIQTTTAKAPPTPPPLKGPLPDRCPLAPLPGGP